MASKVGNCLLIFIVSALFAVQSTTTTPIEKITELMARFDNLEAEVKLLKAEKTELKEDLEGIKSILLDQDEEILLLKSQISKPVSRVPHNFVPYENNIVDAEASSKNEEPLPRASSPPSSCQDLTGFANFVGMDGIYLVANKATKKIEAVFCRFLAPDNILQQTMGQVDVKTKNFNFYVQRHTNFGTNEATIPWETEKLNENGAMNLATGIFTAPVPGIYHFEFSVIKNGAPSNYIQAIYFQVNGVMIGMAYATDTGGTNENVSLAASLRLKANDQVSLLNYGPGVVYCLFPNCHFTGWLVDEDLSTLFA